MNQGQLPPSKAIFVFFIRVLSVFAYCASKSKSFKSFRIFFVVFICVYNEAMLKVLRLDKKMAPAATSRLSGHVADVLQRDPAIKTDFYHCPVSRNLKRESERLKTFKNWPVRFLDPKILAKNGFYYTQTDDIVKCVFCDIQIGYWMEGDDPAADHERERKECPFVKNEPCGNIPVSEGEESDTSSSSSSNEIEVSEDVCGRTRLVLRPFSEPERPDRQTFLIDSTNLWKDFEELGVSKIYGPVSPNYATYASRIKTFEKWKSHEIQKPENMAEAGFYYIGVDDNVLCFHCGGGLKNWEKKDDPWVEHARWFNKCRFVFLQKGREFINEVALRNIPSIVAEQIKETAKEPKKYPEDKKSSQSSKKKESKDSDLKEVDPSTSSSTLSTSSCSTSTSTSKSSAEKENPRTPEEAELKMCIICCTRERGIVFLPCGHFVCCPQCTPSLSKCAVCREPFKATVRAYLS